MQKSFFLSRRIYKICAFSCIGIMIICMLCSCTMSSYFHESKSATKSIPQPNPNDGINYITDVTLYYRLYDTDKLIPLEISISLTSNELAEAAILRALISGVGTTRLYTSAIPASTEIVELLADGDVLYITLDKGFIDNENYSSDSDKKIAIYQIANTLAAYSEKPVQIKIDKDGNGIGAHVSYKELGFDEEYDQNMDYAAPFTFMKSTVATPTNIFQFAIVSLLDDPTIATEIFTADNKRRSITENDMIRLSKRYTVGKCIVTGEAIYDDYAVISCYLMFISNDNAIISTFEGDINMPCYGKLYKVPYDVIFKIAGGNK